MVYEYCQFENKAFTKDGKCIIATLDISSDTFEVDLGVKDEDAELYYNEMMKEYENFKEFLNQE